MATARVADGCRTDWYWDLIEAAGRFAQERHGRLATADQVVGQLAALLAGVSTDG